MIFENNSVGIDVLFFFFVLSFFQVGGSSQILPFDLFSGACKRKEKGKE
jgi:hypothetical protein